MIPWSRGERIRQKRAGDAADTARRHERPARRVATRPVMAQAVLPDKVMRGWAVPPPKPPTKTASQFAIERQLKVSALEAQGLLKSERIKAALLKVRREDFIPAEYRDFAYDEVPLPLPGVAATISCPHSYPLFYEPLGLELGHRFLEIGTGSGYGAAVAREVVGETGQVTSVEIDPLTHEFARQNLVRAGYPDVFLVLGDGGLGDLQHAPYDRIALTAACAEIPPPLIAQLTLGGRIIAPLLANGVQRLTVVTKHVHGTEREALCEVLYVGLQGRYGI
jgi:protein-L-isoaspartate(D-aspartate) O-methyltransferase